MGGPRAEAATAERAAARPPEAVTVRVEIIVGRDLHAESVDAELIPPFAVHETWLGDGYSVTHMPTGTCLREEMHLVLAQEFARELAQQPIWITFGESDMRADLRRGILWIADPVLRKQCVRARSDALGRATNRLRRKIQ